MQRTPENIKMLISLVELSDLLLSEPQVRKAIRDPEDRRTFVINAALVFDREETKILQAAANEWNYNWLDAIGLYAQSLVMRELLVGFNKKLIAKAAREAVKKGLIYLTP